MVRFLGPGSLGAMPSTAGDPASGPVRAVHAALQQARVRADVWRFLRLDTPVLVHSQPKSGTTSLEAALRRAGAGGLKVHFLGPAHASAVARNRAARAPLTYHLYVSARLQRLLPRFEGRLRVITVVRDPIARSVSALFQVPRFAGIAGLDGDALLERVATVLAERTAAGRLGTWFEEEIRDVHGVDLHERGFDIGTGAQRYDAAQGQLLVLRMDRLKDHAQTLSEFTRRPIDLLHSNRRSLGPAAARYALVTQGLRLPPAVVESYYDCTWMRLFFTTAEIDRLRARWTAQGPEAASR